jgi:hypothetical protein|tara:strand:- start:775 stop:1005 length:231 start_codon:yes stop_codon:yes gene_type:complete
MDKETLIAMLHQTEDDYHSLPHYGLIPDWYLRYWDLHIALYQYLGLDKEDYFGPWPLKHGSMAESVDAPDLKSVED